MLVKGNRRREFVVFSWLCMQYATQMTRVFKQIVVCPTEFRRLGKVQAASPDRRISGNLRELPQGRHDWALHSALTTFFSDGISTSVQHHLPHRRLQICRVAVACPSFLDWCMLCGRALLLGRTVRSVRWRGSRNATPPSCSLPTFRQFCN